MRNLHAPIFLLIVFLGCYDNNSENTRKTESINKLLDEKVGERIPTDLGLRWIEKYKSANASARDKSYSVSAQNLIAMLNTSNIKGLSFHHALEEDGTYHIIVIPIDYTMQVWSTSSNRTFIDANSDKAISPTLVRNWIEKYKSENPDKIWFHFWGTEVFDEIKNAPQFEIHNGVDDQGSPQLLLVTYADENLNTRSNREIMMYDVSAGCPPCSTFY